MPKTTKADFAKFEGYVNKWVQRLGLYGWEWQCRHRRLEKSYYAGTTYHSVDRYAVVNLNTAWNEKPTDAQLERTALHEVVEAGLLGRLRDLAENRGFTQDEYDSETHRVVRILENLMLRED